MKGLPEFFGEIGLKVGQIAGLGWLVETEIERHLMGSFTGADEPTGKRVWASGDLLEAELVGAIANVCERGG